MKIDKKIVEKLADLSKLEFNDASKDDIIKDLNRMLEFVGKLNELNTENIEPLAYMTDETNTERSGLREDIVHHDVTHENALKNAPGKDSDYFIVPKVLKKNI